MPGDATYEHGRDGEALDVGVLDAAARADLLRVLESDSRVRADVIRQFYERQGGKSMAES
jgi:hypothetical protein